MVLYGKISQKLKYKIKCTINNPKFQTSLFSEPPDFFYIFRENFTVINYMYNNSLGNSIFFDLSFCTARDNFLLVGINFHRQKLIQANVSKTFNSQIKLFNSRTNLNKIKH